MTKIKPKSVVASQSDNKLLTKALAKKQESEAAKEEFDKIRATLEETIWAYRELPNLDEVTAIKGVDAKATLVQSTSYDYDYDALNEELESLGVLKDCTKSKLRLDEQAFREAYSNGGTNERKLLKSIVSNVKFLDMEAIASIATTNKQVMDAVKKCSTEKHSSYVKVSKA